ncbi:MAG TPA: hypothetical protein VEU76_09110 [Candidatus Udaeobacter sp.]|nr:hypothetical protein [Candidatus Udaeobacter sp.]
MIDGVAAFAVWCGVSLVVLADGRRGLAAGLGLATLALAVLAWPAGGAVGSGALLVGGLVAAVQRLFSGPSGWDVMPAGSTPRLVMCIATGLIALWIAGSVMTGAGAPLRFAVLTGVCLAGARVLGSDDIAAAGTACAALILVIAAGSAVDDLAPSSWLYAAAAAVAIVASWFPRPRVEPR